MRYLAMAFAAVLFAVPVFAVDEAEVVTPGEIFTYEPYTGEIWLQPTVVLVEQGPLSNAGNESQLLDATLLMNLYGFGGQLSALNAMADDFTVPAGEMWDITKITLFAYQTSAGSGASTIAGVYLQIWDGIPGVSNLVWGDPGFGTNYMTASAWSGVYRTLESAPGATNRAIMANEVTPSPDLLLGAGTYYMAWMTDGSASFSGPWINPVAASTDPVTGNGLQSIAGGPFDPAYDTGQSGVEQWQQGIPYIIEGDLTGGTPTENVSWGSLKATFAE